jgi:hypothetical protein
MPSGLTTGKILAGDDPCPFQFLKGSVQEVAVRDYRPLLLGGELRRDGLAREPFRDGAQHLRLLVLGKDFNGGTLDVFPRVKASSGLTLNVLG